MNGNTNRSIGNSSDICYVMIMMMINDKKVQQLHRDPSIFIVYFFNGMNLKKKEWKSNFIGFLPMSYWQNAYWKTTAIQLHHDKMEKTSNRWIFCHVFSYPLFHIVFKTVDR